MDRNFMGAPKTMKSTKILVLKILDIHTYIHTYTIFRPYFKGILYGTYLIETS